VRQNKLVFFPCKFVGSPIFASKAEAYLSGAPSVKLCRLAPVACT